MSRLLFRLFTVSELKSCETADFVLRSIHLLVTTGATPGVLHPASTLWTTWELGLGIPVAG